MAHNISRRSFLRHGVAAGTAIVSADALGGMLARSLGSSSWTDPVALDACGSAILGIRPEDVLMLRRAQEHGVGTTDLNTLTVVRESL